MNLSRKAISLLLGALFFIIGVLTLPHYGINWDTINHLPRGQAYLNYFLTGKKDYSNLPPWKMYWQFPDNLGIRSDIPKNELPKRSVYQSNATTFSWFMDHDGNGHPPLSDILSSSFNIILFQKLRLINDIDSYRVYGILLSSALVGLLFFWVSKYYGKFAGLISALSLALYPLFWSESHFNNEKDIPETVFWMFMFFFLFNALVKKAHKLLLLAGVFFGLALGTKFNVFFSVFVVAPWLLAYFLKNKYKLKDVLKFLPPAIVAGIVGLGIFVASWPYLWADPISRIWGVVKFYKTIGLTETVNKAFVGPFDINLYPLTWIVYTTPLVTLVLFVLGLIAAFKKIKQEKHLLGLLAMLLFIIPVARVSWPGATIYGGIRQIMEYVPAMAMLAGIGSETLRNWLENISGKKLSYIIIALLFVPITLKLIQIHPNENAYFNILTGGLTGAKAKKIPSWGNTFGSGYRQGVSWINKNAENGATVVLAYELLPNIPSMFFRRDIIYYNTARSGYLRKGEYAVTLTYDGTEARSYYDTYLEKFVNPVYEAKVDDTAVVKVWKNDDSHLKKPWQEKLIEAPLLKKIDSGISIDLGKVYNLSKLEIDYSQDNCKKLATGVVRISKDNKKWEDLPGVLPNFWRISVMGEQPSNGHFIEPFVGQDARYINLNLSPNDTCLRQVRSYKVYQLL